MKRAEASPDISKYYFRTTPILESLPARELTHFKSMLTLKKIKKGQQLFLEGQYPKNVCILKRGKVKMYHENLSGTQQIVYIYSAGEMFGYRPLLCGEKHPASAETLEECSVYFMSGADFQKNLARSAFLSNLLLKNLSYEFTVLVNRIAAFGQKSVKERLALSLLILDQKYKKPGETGPSEITLSRSDLAAFVGTTIETIARMLGRFKAEKLIRVAGRKIMIANGESLQLLTE